MIDAACDANADAVKFQTFKSNGVTTGEIGISDYAKQNIGKNMKQIDMIKKYELEYNSFKILKKYCDKKRLIFLSTPHSFDAIDFLDEIVPAYKIGSGDITNMPTLKHVAKKGKPIILGTGMSTLVEVKQAIKVIMKENNDQIIALHCTTNYPCPLNEVNLRAMITMQNELNCLIGYSDHTDGILVPIVATALGAKIIEKHITTDKNLHGPDHKSSLEPNDFSIMINRIRETEKILGNFEKTPTKSEKKIMKYIRKSLVAKHDIKNGSTIRKNLVIIKRPGTGISPTDFDKIIGKKANRNISKDEIFSLDMVE